MMEEAVDCLMTGRYREYARDDPTKNRADTVDFLQLLCPDGDFRISHYQLALGPARGQFYCHMCDYYDPLGTNIHKHMQTHFI